MAELIYHVIDGARCDGTDCTETIDLPQSMDYFAGSRALQALAQPLGWSLWVSRSRRTYCPSHGPRPGSKLRKVW